MTHSNVFEINEFTAAITIFENVFFERRSTIHSKSFDMFLFKSSKLTNNQTKESFVQTNQVWNNVYAGKLSSFKLSCQEFFLHWQYSVGNLFPGRHSESEIRKERERERKKDKKKEWEGERKEEGRERKTKKTDK